jgi:predicted esterase
MRRAIGVAVAAACTSGLASGQDTAASPDGYLVDRIASGADTTQAYALFLPAGYTESRRWPLLLVLDPRGRALLPLQRLRRKANERGYVVMSSYNSLSDGPIEPNIRAMNAMLADAERALAVDKRRFYIVGFSGTARLAWSFARDLGEHAAGIIGIGAGVGRSSLGNDSTWRRIAFYGGSGRRDFNFDEMVSMDALLDTLGVTHRVTYFTGRHEWAPESMLGAALEWMDLQAMKRGLVAYDSSWVEQLARGQIAAAAELEAKGAVADALDAYHAVSADFADLPAGREAHVRGAALGGRADVSAAVRRRAALLEESARNRAVVDLAVGALNARKSRPTAAELARLLKLDSLKAVAAQDDSDAADAAHRLLEFTFVITSFYQPRYYIDRGDGERALIVLDVAAMIDPASPRLCLHRALAWSLLERMTEAMRELVCARQAGVLTTSVLADHAFDKIRRNREFAALVREAGESPASIRP